MRFARIAAAVSTIALLSGCAGAVPHASMGVPPNSQALEQQLHQEAALSAAETFVEVDPAFLVPKSELASEPLPRTLVGGDMELDESVSVTVAQEVIRLTRPLGIAVIPDDAANKAILKLAMPKARPLADVLKAIREQTGIDAILQDGFLYLVAAQPYSVQTLGVAGLGSDLVKQLPLLGADKESVTFNASSGEVTYRASAPSQKRIERTLAILRQDAANITLEAAIYQVDLTKNAGSGVTFGNGVSDGAANLQTAAVAGLGLAGSTSIAGAIVPAVTSAVIDQLMRAMLQVGDVKTLQKPSLTVRSGEGGELSNSGSTPYLENITAGTATTTGVMTTGGASFGKETTGLHLKVNSAAYHAGTVSLDMEISDKEITGWSSISVPSVSGTGTTSTGGTTTVSTSGVSASTSSSSGAQLQQPITSEPKTSSKVTLRPGDMLRISGFIKTQDTLNKETLGNKFDTSLTGKGVRSELVVFARVVVQHLCAKGTCPVLPAPAVIQQAPEAPVVTAPPAPTAPLSYPGAKASAAPQKPAAPVDLMMLGN